MNVIKRREAKALGLKRYFSAKTCPKGHIAEKYVSDKKCVECKSLANKANRGLIVTARAKWLERREHEQPGFWAKYHRDWALRNPGKRQAVWVRHYAVEAAPEWAGIDEIALLYAAAQERTRQTGVLHHVDHVIPLNGKTVCGLHVAHNLQILTASENMKKRNNFNTDQE